MTRHLLALTLLCACLACGKYGAPVRAGVATSGAGVVLDHAADCNDPAHDHGDDPAAGEPTPLEGETPDASDPAPPEGETP